MAFQSRLRMGATGALTGLGIAVVGFVGVEEGLRLNAYKDIVGVWTICYGETLDVKPGDKSTKADCDTALVERLINDFEPAVVRCVTPESAALAPDGLYLSMIEGAYNYGTGAFCKSTAAKRAKAQDWRAACEALTWFNKAGGKVNKGLTARRKRAFDICIGGIPGVKVKTLTRNRSGGIDIAPPPLPAAAPPPPSPALLPEKSCLLGWCW